LGPSTVWLLRRFAAGFEYGPEGFDLDLAETARSLGLGDRSGRHSPFVRSINRPSSSAWRKWVGEDALSVRRRVPPLNRSRVCRLSPPCRPATPPGRTNSSSSVGRAPAPSGAPAALSLMDVGEDYGAAERQLLRWRYAGSVASQAVEWAGAQKRFGLLSTAGADVGPGGDHP